MTKRTFQEIRDLLLLSLRKGRKTINQLAKDAEINWKTTQHHLTYLIGKRMVNEVFSSPYVRIFELTDEGKNYVKIVDPSGFSQFLDENEKKNVTIKLAR